MHNPDRLATPVVLSAFNWSEIFGPWGSVRRTRSHDGNYRLVIETALAKARTRSRS